MFRIILANIRFICVLLFFTSLIFVTESTSEDPYIYFYSNHDGAFVTQSANGDDKQILAVFDSNNQPIYGPGWSHNGEWFAWFLSSPLASINGGYILSTIDNVTNYISITLPDEGQIVDMQWSPIHDRLLIVQESTPNLPHLYIYEPTTGNIVSLYNSNTSGIYRAAWSNFDDQVMLYFLGEDNTSTLTTISLAEELAVTTFAQDNITNFPQVYWSQDGKYLYLLAQPRTLQLVEGVEQTDLGEFENLLEDVSWSPDAEFALVASTNPQNMTELSLLNTNTLEIYTIIDDLDVDTFLFGNTRFLDRGIRSISTYDHWAPNSMSFIFQTGDNILYIYDIVTDTMNSVPIPDSGSATSFWWSSNDTVWIEWAGESDSLYTFDLQTLALVRMFPNNDTEFIINPLFPSSISPQYSYLFFSRITSCGYICVYDVEQEAVLSDIDPIQIDEMEVFPQNTLWHEDGRWALLISDYREQVWVSTFGLENIQLTSIGECSISESCFGWLPE